ncbi:hypothetical protein CYY_001973 [Polysphondylium violaceum]|uniref:Uncharacterized protein n=1 Tax=Polysphondylium violaceum TaxID=133409 RepID=A0A8J4PZ78_9MYCE|nr:hypothetical protein CYY_001973 [Polysphondylium violaceum]
MVLPQKIVLNHPADLPKKNIKIIGNTSEQIKFYKKLHASSGLNVSNCDFSAIQTQAVAIVGSRLGMPNRVKSIYQNNNFKDIRTLEAKCSDDLSLLYSHSNDPNYWITVEGDDGVRYTMMWDYKGSFIYSYPLSITPAFNNNDNTDPNAKYIALVQLGVYSSSTGLFGTQTYKLGLTTSITGVSAATMIALTVGKLMKSSYSYSVDQFPILLTQAANQMNIAAQFYTPKEAEGTLVGHIDFISHFVSYQFFSIRNKMSRIQIFNWDTYSQWTTNTQAIRNAKYPGLEDPSKVYITNTAFTGSTFYPYGYPKPDLTVGCSVYVYYGLPSQVALLVERATNPIEGFTYAFNVHATGPTQNLSGAFIDPKVFLENTQTTDWANKQLIVAATTNSVPVTATIDNTQNDFINIIININKGNPQSLL